MQQPGRLCFNFIVLADHIFDVWQFLQNLNLTYTTWWRSPPPPPVRVVWVDFLIKILFQDFVTFCKKKTLGSLISMAASCCWWWLISSCICDGYLLPKMLISAWSKVMHMVELTQALGVDLHLENWLCWNSLYPQIHSQADLTNSESSFLSFQMLKFLQITFLVQATHL